MLKTVDSDTRRLVVVSSDTHVGPSPEVMRQYCPKKYIDQFDNFASAVENDTNIVAEQFANHPPNFLGTLERLRTNGHFDPHERLRELDSDGVAGEVIFHGSQNGMPVPFLLYVGSGNLPVPDPAYQDLAALGMHMYNEWLSDFCSVQPRRHVGLAQIPIWDIEKAVGEVEWAHNAGLKGINFPAPRDGIPPYNLPCWDRLWATCQEGGMVLNTHVGSGGTAREIYGGQGAHEILLQEITWYSRRALWFMIFGGVFERFPDLRLVLTENPGNWVPPTMMELDAIYDAPNTTISKALPRYPSHYIQTNCYFGASFMARHEAAACIAEGLSSRYMWGSDYPHAEGTYPFSTIQLRSTFAGLPIEDVRQIVGLTAIEAFQLDHKYLADVAGRIGPTEDEVMRPIGPEEIPPEAEFSLGFRLTGAWA